MEPSEPANKSKQWMALTSLTQAAFDNAPVGMVLSSLDPNGDRTIRVANQALAEFLGSTPEELAGRTFNDLTHPDDNIADQAAATRIRDGSDDVFQTRKRYRHSDGTYRWGELHARALRRHDDTAVTLAHILDIGDRVELERTQADSAAVLEQQVHERTAALAASDAELRAALQRAKEQQSRLELLLEASDAGIGEWNLEIGELELSESWSRMLGYEPDQIDLSTVGWQEWVHPEDQPEVQQLIDQVRNGNISSFEHVYRMRHRDGTWRWNQHRGKVIDRFADGRPRRAIGIGTDITDRRTLEAQLIHAAKMQSLGAFAGGIAHDFNNVLAIIQGHTEALADQHEEGDQARRIRSIQDAISRATSLVRKMMVVSRPDSDRGTTLDLTAALTEAAGTVSELVGGDVRVKVTVPTGPVAVRVDEHRFQAIMLNLAANARDAMPVGGSLRIELTAPLGSGDPMAVITVTDTGTGMEPDILDLIFDPYFTTKAPGIGTGLGLATAYMTVSEANGTISAESEPGAGTTIKIEFPLADTPPMRTLPSSELGQSRTADRNSSVSSDTEWSPAVSGRMTGSAGGAIMVVEDEAELLELTTEVLRDHGHRVYSALDGSEALEILETRPDIALLLSDVMMPGISGTELAKIVRRRWPQITTLFMSGYAATNAATDRIDPGRLLTKPVGTEELLRAVSRELGQQARDQ